MKNLFLNREALLQKDDLKIEKVELSRGFVFVREMTAKDKDDWEQSILKQKTNAKGAVQYETSLEDFRAKLAVATVCDEAGNLVFKQSDIKLLNASMSASNMEKIVDVAQRINAITEKDREEILKNSETDQNDSSSSGSVEN